MKLQICGIPLIFFQYTLWKMLSMNQTTIEYGSECIKQSCGNVLDNMIVMGPNPLLWLGQLPTTVSDGFSFKPPGQKIVIQDFEANSD